MNEKILKKYNILLTAGIILLAVCFAISVFLIGRTIISAQKNIIGTIGAETDGKNYINSLYSELSEENIDAGTELFKQYGIEEITLLRSDTGRRLIAITLISFTALTAVIILICMTLNSLKSEYKHSCQQYESQIYDLNNEISTKNYYSQRNRQMQSFIENVAHQVKTPISRVATTLEIIEAENDEQKKHARIEECFRHLDSVRSLMKELTDIGGLEAGKVVFHKEKIRLRELIKDVIFTSGCDETSVKTDIADNIQIFGDYEWLKEALVNICRNSLEHDTSKKPLEIRASLSNENVHLTIRDHGFGINETDVKYIFDRFYVPQTMKKGHTGIGLNLAKLIIDSHNGNIHISNHEKQGTVVNIILPIFHLKEGKI